MEIITPSTEQVEHYLEKWDSLEHYVLQERSLRKLFTRTYPQNVEMDDVLIKVCSLNDYYSTNIFSPFAMARHIVDLNIDKRLSDEDFSLVNDIAVVSVNEVRSINFYSFATKYCSHHRPDNYPIYDSFVEKMLMYFKKKDKFYMFRRGDLKNYEEYLNILKKFTDFYGLSEFSLKQLDKYLWQAGKDFFPKKY